MDDATIANVFFDPGISELQALQPIIAAQQKAELESLKQAQRNAFSDVNKGLTKTGIAPLNLSEAETNRYLGPAYYPALAGVEGGQAEENYGLRSLIAGLGTERGQSRLSYGAKRQMGEETRAQEERLSEKETSARLEARRIEVARQKAEQAARDAAAAELTPEEGAQFEVAQLYQKAIDSGEAPAGYREEVYRHLVQKYGGSVSPTQLAKMVGYYFPDKWENLGGDKPQLRVYNPGSRVSTAQY